MDGKSEKKKELGDGVKSNVRACDVEALKKCLEEHKGDHLKCQSQIKAFRNSCGIKNSPS
ncbi:OLC1v1027439C1 [Oldenlandia corymbosa var. corymbosa]|uniref:OLC1v1027439C1 n=1 Tax=Oldenlandia corymbosa var. corymbosa TaxID=529605 RepID=A0AAV1CBQ4_OLDCO|nr:OLC1v1027439C1 [Oldenlandia corymbosa var. corymbosa]